MLELKQIKDLMAAMGRYGMHRLSLKDGEFELKLESEIHHQTIPLHHEHRGEIPKSLNIPTDSPKVSSQDEGHYLTSPMVGTFYSSPSPEDPPFVKEGDRVDANSVVCIIEAMKVMNEVKAGQTGKIAEMLVTDGHLVEFGTKLFRLEP